MHVCKFSALALSVALLLSTTAQAGEGCCAHCGCQTACQKVCRLVCEEKKVNITCWGCLCEDFCNPGPSHIDCVHCDEVCRECQECDAKTPYSEPKTFVWKDWIPGCAKGVYTKKKLMKKTVTKKVPSFKWVVEDVCAQCEGECSGVEVPPDAQIPPPPKVSARVIPAASTATR